MIKISLLNQVSMNKHIKTYCLTVSILLHTFLLVSFNFYRRPLPMIEEQQAGLWVTSVSWVEASPVRPAHNNKDSVNRLLPQKHPELTRQSELNNADLKRLIQADSPKLIAEKKTVPSGIMLADYRPTTDFKQLNILPAPQKHKPFNTIKEASLSNFSLVHQKVALARNINSLPLYENREDNPALNAELLRYQDSIKEMINAHKIYPRMARKKGIEGVVLVDFLVAKNGQLKDIKLAASSTHKILDQATIRTINSANPFLPFPDSVNKKELWMRLAVSFSLE
jgi:TonB family protein